MPDNEDFGISTAESGPVSGVELPPMEHIDEARRHDWYPLGPQFQRLFYTALKAVGVDSKAAGAQIAALGRRSAEFGLTDSQVRGAIGLWHGIFGKHGEFLRGALSDEDVLKAGLLKEGSRFSDGLEKTFGPDNWRQVEADALRGVFGKPDQVDIATEIRWIRSNLYRWPDFSKAPSQGAINDWLSVMRPGNDALLRDFVNLAWSKRMSPGDKTPKKTAFVEDDAEDVMTAEREAEMRRRLGMGP